MSKLPFVCLNVEPESDVDEDIDETAEIQLEEALKLYHNALKLHAQGPRAYSKTQEAYDELFKNEVFTYPETLSFSKRQAQLDDISERSDGEEDSSASERDDQPLDDPAIVSSDGMPSTLPQVLYLSYKNYGRFQLDRLQHDIAQLGLSRSRLNQLDPDTRNNFITSCRECLETLSEAVDKDDTDPDIWRQVARLTMLLGSPRLARFCLETAVERNGDDILNLSAAPLTSVLARDELQRLFELISDTLASERLQRLSQDNARVPAQISKLLDPCPGLPGASAAAKSLEIAVIERLPIQLKAFSWDVLGDAILKILKLQKDKKSTLPRHGESYSILRPNDPATGVEEVKGRRRKTLESAGGRRLTGVHGQGDEEIVASTEFHGSPGLPQDSPKLERNATDLDHAGSPAYERRLPMRTLSMESIRPGTETRDGDHEHAVSERNNPLKRSPEAAGISQDLPEARSRSKRLRARETIGEEEASSRDQRQQIEKQLKLLDDADRHLMTVCDTLLRRVSVDTMGTLEELKHLSLSGTSDIEGGTSLVSAFSDVSKALKSWSNNKSSLMLHGSGAGATATLISRGNEAGLTSFLEHAKSGQKAAQKERQILSDQDLEGFTVFVNASWLNIDELAVAWLVGVLEPIRDTGPEEPLPPKYLHFKWPIQLKLLVHEVLSLQEDYLYKRFEDLSMPWNDHYSTGPTDQANEYSSIVSTIQTIFEIHLDMFDAMIKPTSKVDQPTRALEKARLQRWSLLANQAMANRDAGSGNHINGGVDITSARHVLSMTLYMSLDEESTREHVLLCLQDVKEIVKQTLPLPVYLPNLDIMPEISVNAVEQEISRLTTTDFFISVFNPNEDDPVATIESLEPIIMPLHDPNDFDGGDVVNGEMTESSDQPYSPSGQLLREECPETPPGSQRRQLLDFLDKSTASLRLSLWNRLSNAYAAIESPPFVFLCTVYSMSIVLSELRDHRYLSQPEDTRTANLLVWIRNLVDLVDKCVTLTSSEPSALDCMDEKHLKLALVSFADCAKLFHLFAVWDDTVRLGQSPPPTQQPGGANAFKQSMNMLREMQVKTWRLLYVLLREAASQQRDLFADLDDDFLAYLAAVHSSIGLREYCKHSKKSFLKFMKGELLNLKPSDLQEWRYQMAQLAYDMYDLRVLADSNAWQTLQEHKCPPDQLDRVAAREILPMVMAQIEGINVRDIIKPDRRDFKQAIDKIQDLIGSPKASSSQQSFNRKQLLAFQKMPIRGSELDSCLRGIGGLTNMPIKNEYFSIAKTGWYFVVGYLRLASFRSVKRTGPDSIKELDEAASFLKIDIDYNSEKWETWYRLAQTYDSMLDEEVTWTADRINNKMEDLVTLQRQAIHCYQAAIALAVRNMNAHSANCGSGRPDSDNVLVELYSDFGKRLYASSRPPFDMQAFSVTDHGRWYYAPTGQKFKAKPFHPMTAPAVWLFSSVLFRQVIADGKADWQSYYMLGKCLWKLLRHQDAGGLSHETVLEAFARACEVAPNKDTRHPEKGPILEPHVKLVSVVHKLVEADKITTDEGSSFIRRTPYSQRTDLKQPKGMVQWRDYVRHVLRNLRVADKANWHHRIMSRAAKVAFEDELQENPAEAAIQQLTPHIFTKTMVVQVWRTAFERAGRHFVYTSRYVKFFIALLDEVGDRISLEALGRRVRKKQAEFIDHLGIWTTICKTHISLLRSQLKVPENHEENLLSILPYETFVPNAALLQAWAQPAAGDPPAHPLLGVIREAIDLKKLNLNLIANQGIDDLIGDAYAKLYEEMVPGLFANATNEKNREAMRVDRILMGDPSADERTDTGAENAIPLTNPSGRAKIVGRMEVRRRAEALVQRPAMTLQPVKGRAAALAEAAAKEQEDEEEEDDDSERHGSAQSPEAANEADDADDESELSELEDELEEPLDPIEGDGVELEEVHEGETSDADLDAGGEIGHHNAETVDSSVEGRPTDHNDSKVPNEGEGNQRASVNSDTVAT